MLRSILVALDDTPGAMAARDLAIALARRTGASLTAATILDKPHIEGAIEAVPPGAGAFQERRNAALLRQAKTEAESAFAACVAAAGDFPFTRLELDDAPEPALLAACAEHDLIVIGRDSTLGREENEDGLAPVIEAMLKEGARPLLVVPPSRETAPLPEDGGILVAYDGSIPSMRALQLFALLGLHEGRPVRVVSLGASAKAAEALAERAASYLRSHGIAARAVGVAGTHPLETLLAEAASMPAGLMVAGAYGKSGLRNFFFGSTTRHLLRDSPCPVFVHH